MAIRGAFSGKARAKGGGFQSGRRLRVNVYVNGVLTQEKLQGTMSGGDGATSVTVTEAIVTEKICVMQIFFVRQFQSPMTQSPITKE